jgi:hypothetical protein
MDFPLLVTWALIALPGLVALWALRTFLAGIRRDRLFTDTPLVRLRAAAQGYVKVRGRALPAGDAPTAAPLSRRPCVWWSFEVERRNERRRNDDNRWESVECASSVETFLLNDGDGECLVGPVSADITPTTKNVWYGDEPRPFGPPPASQSLLTSGAYRYTEAIIAAGETVSVLGELSSHSDVGDIAALTAGVLRAWKADQPALLARFDKNHDGHIDADEWESARQAADAFVRKENLGKPITRMTVIGPPVNGQPFVITPMASEQLVRREQLRAALHFCVGLGAVIVLAFAIEYREALHYMVLNSQGN